MSPQQISPSLDQYPGYFPAAKPPFWTRAKVGVAAGLMGLLVGTATGAASADPAPPPVAQGSATVAAPAQDLHEKIDAAVADAREEMGAQLDDVRQAADRRLTQARRRAAVAQRHAVRQAVSSAVARAVARTRTVERAQAARAVAAAKANAAVPPAPAPLASVPAPSGGGTDPHFSYCYEANDAGYGPYYQGQDTEYGWYDDADGDGVVCES